jgi:hypothetical protein
MFIELTEVITAGITAGHKRQVSINTNRIISFTPVESGDGTNIEVKRGVIRVKQTYDEVKELIA